MGMEFSNEIFELFFVLNNEIIEISECQILKFSKNKKVVKRQNQCKKVTRLQRSQPY